MRVLVVEDEKKIADFLGSGLRAESFAVDLAEDGEKASYLGRTNDYDLIVLDIMLPQKSGLVVLNEIRSTGKTIPVIVLSVKTETITKIELLNAGADDYLVKPFSFQELMARIRALLRRPRQLMGEVFQLDDLILDSKKHLVKRGEREIRLTLKEFTLLEFFLKNQGVVLSRGMMMEHVWDMSADPFSNTIESHILSLRKKIEFADKRKLIHTISGRGYKIA